MGPAGKGAGGGWVLAPAARSSPGTRAMRGWMLAPVARAPGTWAPMAGLDAGIWAPNRLGVGAPLCPGAGQCQGRVWGMWGMGCTLGGFKCSEAEGPGVGCEGGWVGTWL